MGLFSNSKSSVSTSLTQNIDGRVVAGEKSSPRVNTTTGDGNLVGGEGSNIASTHAHVGGVNNAINITSTDHGAVSGSLALALAGVEGAQKLARETQQATGGLLDGALRMVGEQQQQFTAAVENIKTSDVRTLIMVGMAVVGIAAAFAFKR